MTAFIPAFSMHVLGGRAELGHNPARMLLIIRRPYAHLEDRLRSAFAGRDNVEIIVDRRRGERRRRNRPVQTERRRTERRTLQDNILDVVIEGGGK